MSVPLTVGGVTFQYPQQFDRNWGPTLTGWSTAVTNVLAAFPSTGVLTLSPYPSSTLNFANATNTGFLALTINGSNQLTFNGTPIGAAAALTDGHVFVGNVSNQPVDVAMTGDVTISDTGVTTLGALKVGNAQIATLAAIALTKLASTSPYFWYVANSAGVLSPIGVTASRAVITDANGLPSASTVTPTELSYLSGVTSSIQSQLGTYLPLSGGTMSGAISMASNKITSLAAGTNVGDAATFGQLPGPAGTITNWVRYTPSLTGFGTPFGVDFMWRRVGDTLSVKGTFIPGTPTASAATISLPGSLVASITAVSNQYICGSWSNATASLVTEYAIYLAGNDSFVTVAIGNGTFLIPALGNQVSTAGQDFYAGFEVPITGWSI